MYVCNYCFKRTMYIISHVVCTCTHTVDRASARILINATSEELCFMTSSPLDCDVVQLTQYNVTINDITGNFVLKEEQIPENTCVPLDDLPPQCGPHRVSVQPYNEHLLYTPVSQEITSGKYTHHQAPITGVPN